MIFRKLRVWVNEHPLAKYGGMYVVAVFGFAFLYWMLPGQFYHSTSALEPALKNDEDRIKASIQAAVIRQAKDNFPDGKIRFSRQIASINSYRIVDFRLVGSRFHVRSMLENDSSSMPIPWIEFFADDVDPELSLTSDVVIAVLINHPETGTPISAPAAEALSVATTADADQRDIESDEPSFEEAPAPPKSVSTRSGDVWFERLFKTKHPTYRYSLQGLQISKTTLMEMQAYVAAKNGFAGEATGSFWRMLYLSTVTITTLGYGDIVPITPTSRTLIAVEAVLGMLIIGLYLNALSNRLRS